MKLITRQVPISFNIFLFGDTHLGSILFDQEGFGRFVQTVQEDYEGVPAKHNYVIDHGDAIEAIAVDDKRYDPRVVTNPMGTPFEQAQEYVKLVDPIKKHIVVRLKGNHEQTLCRFGNLAEYMSRELGVPYGTFSCRVTWTDHKDDLIFKTFHTHGRKSITSTADDPKRRLTNQHLILKRHLKHKAGDTLLMSKAHTHKLLICKPNTELYLTDNGQEIEQQYTHSNRASGYIHPDHRWYVNTGSFFRLYATGEDGYAERSEYDPVELGWVVVLVRDRHIEKVRRCVL